MLRIARCTILAKNTPYDILHLYLEGYREKARRLGAGFFSVCSLPRTKIKI